MDLAPPCEFTDKEGRELYIGPKLGHRRLIVTLDALKSARVALDPEQMRTLAGALMYWAEKDANAR